MSFSWETLNQLKVLNTENTQNREGCKEGAKCCVVVSQVAFEVYLLLLDDFIALESISVSAQYCKIHRKFYYTILRAANCSMLFTYLNKNLIAASTRIHFCPVCPESASPFHAKMIRCAIREYFSWNENPCWNILTEEERVSLQDIEPMCGLPLGWSGQKCTVQQTRTECKSVIQYFFQFFVFQLYSTIQTAMVSGRES